MRLLSLLAVLVAVAAAPGCRHPNPPPDPLRERGGVRVQVPGVNVDVVDPPK
jgi:hypothetical protein